MKLANTITIRVFDKEEDNHKETLKGLFELLGMTKEEIEEQKIEFKEQRATGFSQKEIMITEVVLEKDRHCNTFIKKLNEALTKEDKEKLITQTNRLDDNLDFFLRLNKDKLINAKYELTDTGECYHIKISVAAFPKNKMTAHRKIKEIFE